MTTAPFTMPALPEAACKDVTDPEVFFPHSTEERRLEQARNYCRRCPIVRDCLAWALTNAEEHGVWAGTTPEQRKNLADRHARSTP